ncbi:alternative ribosome rescue aminoacyl-tRNA hydrolase ArfB [Actinomadura sp. DC4]|uniref:alternative ribosome rescue aminoacyl-tRNA hydrolase ArfB n=1 Tax=Actinomadura sp. DC4 TaxID=3055069 RepID=UPI0025AF6AA2|nr:alternative ribosome rescue aminoacyl-tRNA hydrolase ArfB [Actinomadura sp. DC4]MDN3359194.1 alternative ribosome rescue aminoacyl-tRNA hydrolase ArfB [Actinomadura sp. DC4]
MSGPVRVRGSVIIPDAELSWRFSRSSGPGGQHVNTSDSAAELSFDLVRSVALPQAYKERAVQRLAGRLVNGVLTIRAEEHRSQLRNREAAKVRLSALLSEATAPPPKSRRPTKPSRRVQARRLDGKRRRGQIKRGRSGRFDD